VSGAGALSREPWTRIDLAGLLTFALIGLAGLGVAVAQARGALRADDQELWIDVGVGAVTFGAVGNGLFLLQGRRRVSARRRLLLRPDPGPVVLRALPDDTAGRGLARGGGPGGAGPLVAAPPMTRYHRAGCHLVAGKAAVAQTRHDHEAASRRPCAICRP
jgi:hypothetical protein